MEHDRTILKSAEGQLWVVSREKANKKNQRSGGGPQAERGKVTFEG
jgi:hypothetical protein